MKSVPFKRVGAPASFKGVRGSYLNKFLLKAGIAFFLVIAVMPFSFPWMIKVGWVIACFGYIYFVYIKLLAKSKGDINGMSKKECRKVVNIKGSKLNP